jgi:hypothetical protein
VEECGHTVVRADEEQRPDVIGVKTINHLFGNDLNGDNPNVFHRSTRSRIGTDGGMPARAGPGRSSAAQAHGHPHRFGARRGRSSLVRRGTTGSASTCTEHPDLHEDRGLLGGTCA